MTAGDRARVRRIADGIVAAHASYRRRVRWAVAAGAAVAVVAAVPSLLVLNQPRESAAASGGGWSAGQLRAEATRPEPSDAPTTYRPDDVIRSDGAGGTLGYAGALLQWHPHGVIRVYRPSTTAVQRAELRAVLGRRVRFVGASAHAAVLHMSGAVSLPRASSAHGSSS